MPEFHLWVNPAAFLAGGILFGIIFEKIVLSLLRRIAVRTKWEADEIILDSLKGSLFLWFFLVGAYGALQTGPIEVQVVRFIEKLLLVLFILSIAAAVARMTAGFIHLQSRRYPAGFTSASIVVNLARFVIFLLAFLTILQSFGIYITPVLTALGLGGLAVALALQDPLANLFSGLQIIASGQISRGDYIRLQTGEEGYVTDITWRTTTIVALANYTIIVPNSKLASNIMTNFHLPQKEVGFPVMLRVGYNCDLSLVETVTLDVATGVMKEVPGGVPEFQPVVRFVTFGETGILFNVALRAREFSDQPVITHEFLRRLHERYRKEGIEIPVPFLPKR